MNWYLALSMSTESEARTKTEVHSSGPLQKTKMLTSVSDRTVVDAQTEINIHSLMVISNDSGSCRPSD